MIMPERFTGGMKGLSMQQIMVLRSLTVRGEVQVEVLLAWMLLIMQLVKVV